jgi:hypothetical protein
MFKRVELSLLVARQAAKACAKICSSQKKASAPCSLLNCVRFQMSPSATSPDLASYHIPTDQHNSLSLDPSDLPSQSSSVYCRSAAHLNRLVIKFHTRRVCSVSTSSQLPQDTSPVELSDSHRWVEKKY